MTQSPSSSPEPTAPIPIPVASGSAAARANGKGKASASLPERLGAEDPLGLLVRSFASHLGDDDAQNAGLDDEPLGASSAEAGSSGQENGTAETDNGAPQAEPDLGLLSAFSAATYMSASAQAQAINAPLGIFLLLQYVQWSDEEARLKKRVTEAHGKLAREGLVPEEIRGYIRFLRRIRDDLLDLFKKSLPNEAGASTSLFNMQGFSEILETAKKEALEETLNGFGVIDSYQRNKQEIQENGSTLVQPVIPVETDNALNGKLAVLTDTTQNKYKIVSERLFTYGKQLQEYIDSPDELLNGSGFQKMDAFLEKDLHDWQKQENDLVEERGKSGELLEEWTTFKTSHIGILEKSRIEARERLKQYMDENPMWLSVYFAAKQPINGGSWTLDEKVEHLLQEIPALTYQHPLTGDNVLHLSMRLLADKVSRERLKKYLPELNDMISYFMQPALCVQFNKRGLLPYNPPAEGKEWEGIEALRDKAVWRVCHDAHQRDLVRDAKKLQLTASRQELKTWLVRAVSGGYPLMVGVALGGYVKAKTREELAVAEESYYAASYQQSTRELSLRYWEISQRMWESAARWAQQQVEQEQMRTRFYRFISTSADSRMDWSQTAMVLTMERARLIDEATDVFEDWLRSSVKKGRRAKYLQEFKQSTAKLAALENRMDVNDLKSAQEKIDEIKRVRDVLSRKGVVSQHEALSKLNAAYKAHWYEFHRNYQESLEEYDHSNPTGFTQEKETVAWQYPLVDVDAFKFKVFADTAQIEKDVIFSPREQHEGQLLLYYAASATLKNGGGNACFPTVVLLLQRGARWDDKNDAGETVLQALQKLNSRHSLNTLVKAANQSVEFGDKLQKELLSYLTGYKDWMDMKEQLRRWHVIPASRTNNARNSTCDEVVAQVLKAQQAWSDEKLMKFLRVLVADGGKRGPLNDSRFYSNLQRIVKEYGQNSKDAYVMYPSPDDKAKEMARQFRVATGAREIQTQLKEQGAEIAKMKEERVEDKLEQAAELEKVKLAQAAELEKVKLAQAAELEKTNEAQAAQALQLQALEAMVQELKQGKGNEVKGRADVQATSSSVRAPMVMQAPRSRRNRAEVEVSAIIPIAAGAIEVAEQTEGRRSRRHSMPAASADIEVVERTEGRRSRRHSMS